jgi:hypothetical protein
MGTRVSAMMMTVQSEDYIHRAVQLFFALVRGNRLFWNEEDEVVRFWMSYGESTFKF